MLKVFLCLAAVGTGALLGIRAAKTYSCRLKLLMELRNGFAQLENSVVYGSLPLIDAFEAVKSGEYANPIFRETAGNLRENRSIAVQASFMAALESLPGKGYLDGEDMAVIAQFTEHLGSSGLSGQQKNFEFIQKQLGQRIEEARYRREKNQRMAKSLGVLGGMFVALMIL
jgi:stage III sporulation protein AB